MAEELEFLDFSYNWNGKLGCKAFTTLRLFNPGKYEKGRQFLVRLGNGTKNSRVMGTAEVIESKQVKRGQINEYIAHLDTGYSLKETQAILSRMYPNSNWETSLSFVLLRYVKDGDMDAQQDLIQAEEAK